MPFSVKINVVLREQISQKIGSERVEPEELDGLFVTDKILNDFQ